MTFLLNILFALLSALPGRLMDWLSHPLGWIAWKLSPTKRNSTEKNLAACYPEMDDKQRDQLGRESMRHYMLTVLESGRIWYWSRARVRARFDETEGIEHLVDALIESKGVLALVPHFGNWEFSAQGFGDTPVLALYKPGENRSFDQHLLEKRLQMGTDMAATNQAGLKKIYRHLSSNGLVIQLPDQDPSGGQGRFVPFFGVPASTGVLASRLIQRTGCRVIFAACVRTGSGRYRVVFQAADQEIYSSDTEESLAAVNRGVEKMIALDPAQYLWAYKRFKTRPEGEKNFYRP
jgi:KDO2-lipid IV(A) lauroyltransferase